MTDHQDDPVLKKQAENRVHLDKMLEKHGWKLGKVGARNGAVIVYNLEKLDGSGSLEHRILLSDILVWSMREGPEPGPGLPDFGTLMLGLQLVLRVKYENKQPKKEG